jgi:nucleoid-associated protein YgaU
MAHKFNPVKLVEVKPKSGNNTRLQYANKKKNGLPNIIPTEKPNKVVLTKGDKLRVSDSNKTGKNWSGHGPIKGADGRSYFYITDDVFNGKAAKYFVKETDVVTIGYGEVYTVKSGDNLTKIAKEFSFSNKDVDIIYKANKDIIGKNKNLIYPDQMLFIPFNTH